jgi:hypothetical protein
MFSTGRSEFICGSKFLLTKDQDDEEGDTLNNPLKVLLRKHSAKNESNEEKVTDANSDKKESILDPENYNDYIKLEKKNKIIQSIKASKKCFNCTFPGCKKKYSAPYNLKVYTQ